MPDLFAFAVKSRGTASSILPGGLVQGLYWDCINIVDWSWIAGMLWDEKISVLERSGLSLRMLELDFAF